MNAVAVLPANGTDLGRQTAEYIASDRIYDDEWFASNPMQRREAPLAHSRFPRNLRLADRRAGVCVFSGGASRGSRSLPLIPSPNWNLANSALQANRER